MSDSVYIPPQALDAEKAVLGAVLLDNRSIHDLPTQLKGEAFYSPMHGRIFAAMLTLIQHEAPVDVISVSDQLKKAGHDIPTGQLVDLSDLGMPRSIGYHANLVLEAWRQRRTIEVVQGNLLELQNQPSRVDEIVSQLSVALDDKCQADASYSIGDVMVATLKRLDQSSDSS